MVAAAAVLAASFLMLRGMPANHDIAWPLYAAGLILDGARPYVDVIEVHPPAIVVFAVVAQLLGSALGVSAIAAYHALTLGVVGLALGLSALVLRWRNYDRRVRGALLVIGAVVLGPLVGYSFGLEEHLMACLLLPYLLAMPVDEQRLPTGLAVIIGLAAGVGLVLKPMFVLAWGLLELVAALRFRGRSLIRPAAITCAAVLLLYPLFVLLVFPAYLQVARWAAQVYYSFHAVPLSQILFSNRTALVGSAGAITLGMIRSAELRRVALLIGVFMFGCWLVVLLQAKGWAYHWYPALALAALLGGAGLVDAAGRLGERSRAPITIVALATVVLVGFTRLQSDVDRYGQLADEPYHLAEFKSLIESGGGPRSVGAFSTTMQVAFPLINYLDGTWASRFSTLWLLPGLYEPSAQRRDPFPYHKADEMPPLEKYLVDAVYEDMVRHRPRFLIVDRAPPIPGMRGFDYLTYFGNDARLRALLGDYVPYAEVGRRYRVFQRETDGER